MVTVSFGGVSQNHTLVSSDAFQRLSLAVMPGVDLFGQAIVFDHAGGDNIGLILDSVSLTSTVPEPSTMLLLDTGLIGMGVLRRRKL